jgi:hypothetical protein
LIVHLALLSDNRYTTCDASSYKHLGNHDRVAHTQRLVPDGTAFLHSFARTWRSTVDRRSGPPHPSAPVILPLAMGPKMYSSTDASTATSRAGDTCCAAFLRPHAQRVSPPSVHSRGTRPVACVRHSGDGVRPLPHLHHRSDADAVPHEPHCTLTKVVRVCEWHDGLRLPAPAGREQVASRSPAGRADFAPDGLHPCLLLSWPRGDARASPGKAAGPARAQGGHNLIPRGQHSPGAGHVAHITRSIQEAAAPLALR